MSKIPIFTTPLLTPKKQQPRSGTPSRIPIRTKGVRETVKGSMKINNSPLKAAQHGSRETRQTHLSWKTMKLGLQEPATPVPLKPPMESGVLPSSSIVPLGPTPTLPTNCTPNHKSETPILAECPQPNPGKRKVYSTGFDPRFPVLKRVRKEKSWIPEWDATKNNDKEPEVIVKSTPPSEIGTKPVAECSVLMEEALARMYLLYQCLQFAPYSLLMITCIISGLAILRQQQRKEKKSKVRGSHQGARGNNGDLKKKEKD